LPAVGDVVVYGPVLEVDLAVSNELIERADEVRLRSEDSAVSLVIKLRGGGYFTDVFNFHNY